MLIASQLLHDPTALALCGRRTFFGHAWVLVASWPQPEAHSYSISCAPHLLPRCRSPTRGWCARPRTATTLYTASWATPTPFPIQATTQEMRTTGKLPTAPLPASLRWEPGRLVVAPLDKGHQVSLCRALPCMLSLQETNLCDALGQSVFHISGAVSCLNLE